MDIVIYTWDIQGGSVASDILIPIRPRLSEGGRERLVGLRAHRQNATVPMFDPATMVTARRSFQFGN